MQKLSFIAGIITILLIAGMSFADEKSATKTALQALTLEEIGVLKTKAVQGDVRSALILGEAHFNGKIVRQNYREAASYYRIAAEKGSPMGQTNLGYMYDQGLGLKKNQVEALTWYQKAAIQGDSTAMLNAGMMYEAGIGTETDMDEAVYWYRRAAELGESEALEFMSGIVAIHETEETDVMGNFLEDVLTLLPTELAETLNRDGGLLYEAANFQVLDDYWRRSMPGNADVLRDCAILARRLKNTGSGDSQNTAMLFGSMVRNILEIAMIPSTPDPMNYKLEGNLKKFFRDSAYSKWQIDHHGYQIQSLESIVGRLYGLRIMPKTSIYSDVVVITADLWTTLWGYAGKDPRSAPINIVRTSFLDNFIDMTEY